MPTFVSALLLSASTDLVVGVPRRLARAFERRLPIQLHTLPGRPFRFEMCAFWQRRTNDDPGSRYFRQLLLEAARA